MSDAAKRYWEFSRFHKGYLPAKEDVEAASFVVLARYNAEPWGTLKEDFNTINIARFEHGEEPFESMEEVFIGDSPRFDAGAEQPMEATSFEASPAFYPDPDLPQLLIPGNEASEYSGEESSPSASVMLGNKKFNKNLLGFYLCKKAEVTPPPFKYTMSSKKLNRCFFMCGKPNCYCDRPHPRADGWHVRLDTLCCDYMLVSDNGQNRRVAAKDIVPTAGYFFDLGLKAIGAVKAVIPILCRFNKDCRNGAGCLYIHANIDRASGVAEQNAETPLRKWVYEANLTETLNEEEISMMLEFLAEEGIKTVGDLQVLGVHSFEALGNRIPSRWSSAFLVLSLLRNFDLKYPLEKALITFPRVPRPLSLPPNLQKIGDLFSMPHKELYQVNISPLALDACEILRSRYALDDEYNMVTLSKENKDSFFVKVSDIIRSHCEDSKSAHFSWRKHDRTRPLVTSVFTYVDVIKCNCGAPVVSGALEEDGTVEVSLPAVSPEMDIGLPPFTWCRCPRYWVIAVNYELSTPSGSRCSEQNAMGKLASSGVPTWAVREVFVHGKNIKKEVNPLFPCGVCENMLQKVNKDIFNRYGEDATLYMYDATEPRKIVYLPFPEISHRDGNRFKQFVSQDLRSGVFAELPC